MPEHTTPGIYFEEVSAPPPSIDAVQTLTAAPLRQIIGGRITALRHDIGGGGWLD